MKGANGHTSESFWRDVSDEPPYLIASEQSEEQAYLDFNRNTDPLWRGLDFGSRLMAGIFSSAALQAANGADRHIVIAEKLATQADAGGTFRRHDVTFGDRDANGLARKEFYSARGARALPLQACNWSMLASSVSANTSRLPTGTSKTPTQSTVNFGIG